MFDGWVESAYDQVLEQSAELKRLEEEIETLVARKKGLGEHLSRISKEILFSECEWDRLVKTQVRKPN